MADRWSTIHKQKLDDVVKKKDEARVNFFDWVKSKPIQEVINKKFKKGLWIKFEQCCKTKAASSGGVS